MRRPLVDYIEQYEVDSLQLLYGEHCVSINCKGSGSYRLLKNFMDGVDKYEFVSYNEEHKHLILKFC